MILIAKRGSIYIVTLVCLIVDLSEREIPPLGQGVYSFWVVEGVPAVEAFCLLGGVAGEQVYHRETPSGRNRLEHVGVKTPV
jgi:hypothetical protein